MTLATTSRALPLRIVNAAASLGVALGIAVQIATGVDEYPTPPPGAILAVVAAAAVAFVPWRYIGIIALAFPVWIAVGAAVTSGTADRLGDPSSSGPFIGTLVQMIAVAVGILTGAALLYRGVRSRGSA